MGADVAGRDPGEGGRKKRRSMVRIPADEVPHPNASPISNHTDPSTPAFHEPPADELVDHAFSNGGVAEGLVPAARHLSGFEADELDALDAVDGEDADELSADDAEEMAPDDVAEADTDPRALRDRGVGSAPNPSAAIAALVRAVAMPPPPSAASSPSPWSDPPPPPGDDSGPVLSSSPPPAPTGRAVAVGAAMSGHAGEDSADGQVLAPPTSGPTLPPPSGSEAHAPVAAIHSEVTAPTAQGATPSSERDDGMELDGAELEEVVPPPAETPRQRTVTPVVPPAAMNASPPALPRPSAPPAPPSTPSAAPAAAGAQPAADSPLRPRKKRRAKQWFEEIFDDDYLRTLPFLTARQTEREAAFIAESLAVSPGGTLLDLACGYGRHAMELAGKGYQVTGLDLSLPLLIRAADAARRSGLTVNFSHGDMREMTNEDEFDGAYCTFTSYGYFDDDTNRKVAANLARAIKPGGRLLIDVVNRDYLVRDLPTRVWWQGEGCVVLEEVDFNYFSSRLQVQRSIIFEDGRQAEQEISIRAYSLHEIGKVLHHAGFRVTEISGGLALRGKFFGASSRQLIVLAEKKTTP